MMLLIDRNTERSRGKVMSRDTGNSGGDTKAFY